MRQGRIYGIDCSATMLESAQKQNKQAIDSGLVNLQLGDVISLPFTDNYFDIVYSINCIYFWEPPAPALAEIYRVLKPGGSITITARDRNDEEVYARLNPHAVKDLLQSAGFINVKSIDGLNPKHPIFWAIGNKPN